MFKSKQLIATRISRLTVVLSIPFIMTAVVLAGSTSAYAAGNLTDTQGIINLIYNSNTGNVTFDTEGGPMAGFQLENLVGGDDFIPGNFLPPFGTLPDATATVLGDSNPFGPITGVFDIGDVFPTGLDLSGLESFLSKAEYTAGFSQPITEFDLIIPEPATAVMIGLGGLMMLRRTRRSNA